MADQERSAPPHRERDAVSTDTVSTDAVPLSPVAGQDVSKTVSESRDPATRRRWSEMIAGAAARTPGHAQVDSSAGDSAPKPFSHHTAQIAATSGTLRRRPGNAGAQLQFPRLADFVEEIEDARAGDRSLVEIEEFTPTPYALKPWDDEADDELWTDDDPVVEASSTQPTAAPARSAPRRYSGLSAARAAAPQPKPLVPQAKPDPIALLSAEADDLERSFERASTRPLDQLSDHPSQYRLEDAAEAIGADHAQTPPPVHVATSLTATDAIPQAAKTASAMTNTVSPRPSSTSLPRATPSALAEALRLLEPLSSMNQRARWATCGGVLAVFVFSAAGVSLVVPEMPAETADVAIAVEEPGVGATDDMATATVDERQTALADIETAQTPQSAVDGGKATLGFDPLLEPLRLSAMEGLTDEADRRTSPADRIGTPVDLKFFTSTHRLDPILSGYAWFEEASGTCVRREATFVSNPFASYPAARVKLDRLEDPVADVCPPIWGATVEPAPTSSRLAALVTDDTTLTADALTGSARIVTDSIPSQTLPPLDAGMVAELFSHPRQLCRANGADGCASHTLYDPLRGRYTRTLPLADGNRLEVSGAFHLDGNKVCEDRLGVSALVLGGSMPRAEAQAIEQMAISQHVDSSGNEACRMLRPTARPGEFHLISDQGTTANQDPRAVIVRTVRLDPLE
ncbi:MAG: hypothetical protein AAFV62_01780 [Pseudomonadota bacterium]